MVQSACAREHGNRTYVHTKTTTLRPFGGGFLGPKQTPERLVYGVNVNRANYQVYAASFQLNTFL